MKTPASPLPWTWNDGQVRDANGQDCDAPAKSLENISYMIHASNAYPKLVEALRRFSDRSDEDVNHFGRADDAGKLLRELGEAQ